MTGGLAILAEAAHSGLDLLAAAMKRRGSGGERERDRGRPARLFVCPVVIRGPLLMPQKEGAGGTPAVRGRGYRYAYHVMQTARCAPSAASPMANHP